MEEKNPLPEPFVRDIFGQHCAQRIIDQDQTDSRFECYRSNHFEIALTESETGLKVEDLRLSTAGAKLDKLSGKLTLSVHATRAALEYINTLSEGMLYNIEYILYSPDCSRNVVILNRLMKLTDISFESCYNAKSVLTTSSEVSVIELHFCYA